MPCTSPFDAYSPAPGAADRRLVFSPQKSDGMRAYRLPCGKCISCLLNKSKSMGLRCVHEMKMHAAEGRGTIFATLTFDGDHVPADHSVSVKFIQRFHYRLRQIAGPFRFLLGAEYGDGGGRPHYHAIYFGLDFREDRYPWKKRPAGQLYRSPTFEKAWPYGFCHFADATLETADYTCRYTLKKARGSDDPDKYRRVAVDPQTGEVREWHVAREFMLSSRKPGIGGTWFDANRDDVFPSDFIIRDGAKLPVPAYYLNRLPEAEREKILAARRAERRACDIADPAAISDPELAQLSREEREFREQQRRKLIARGHYSRDGSDARLRTKAEARELKAKGLLRPLDAEG